MTTIYTNPNNPSALKLIVAKNFSKINADIKIINHEGSVREARLPYLEVNNKIIFIPNAAIWYMFPPSKEHMNLANEWLEWESNTLAPNLVFAFGNSLKSNNIKDKLISNLQFLNSSLENKACLIGNTVNVCDIAIWASLYPLIHYQPLASQYLNQLKNICAWFEGLENQSQFKEAVSIYNIANLDGAFGAMGTGAKYISSETFSVPDVSNSVAIETLGATPDEVEAAKKAFSRKLSDLPNLKKKDKVVLPVPGEKNVFITSALPYVNNVPHLGNIIGCVLSADVFARFSRLCNYNTLFICGTDEYGTATETKALEENMSCQAICDKYYKIHSEIYQWFNISFDFFGRTSLPEQTEMCQKMFLKLNDNGFMFTQSVEQLHCKKCDRYLADRFVEGECPHIGCNYDNARGDQCDGCGKLVNAVELKNPRCKICSNKPTLKTSSQFFIDLPKLEPLLHHWMKQSAPGWSNNAQVIAKAWLKEGLKPRCITRDLKWGVPVPLDGFRNKVFYVWFDAPIGYMSITKAYIHDDEKWNKWWRPENDTKVTLYQFMAKDNVPFHSVLFPAMLLGTNLNYVTVSHIMATEYLNYEGGKFSKSRGVGVFGTDARNTDIASDVWRFYLLYVRPESQDSSFSWTDLATKNNSELLNNLGNFVNRTLVFAKKSFGQCVPEMFPKTDDYVLLAACTREYKSYISCLENGKLRDGIRHILAISRHGNQYYQSKQPWVAMKGSEDDRKIAQTVIGICCNLIGLLTMLIQPYMPTTSEKMKTQLNIEDIPLISRDPQIVSFLPAGHQLGSPTPLFEKIDMEVVNELSKKFSGQ